jgi:hypothetical protein
MAATSPANTATSRQRRRRSVIAEQLTISAVIIAQPAQNHRARSGVRLDSATPKQTNAVIATATSHPAHARHGRPLRTRLRPRGAGWVCSDHMAPSHHRRAPARPGSAYQPGCGNGCVEVAIPHMIAHRRLP